MLNVKVDRKEILKAIQIVENSVTENKIREVLSGIYIEAKENCIILKGTDLELSINTEISGEINSEGKIVIKHKLIEEFLKQITDEKIELIERLNVLSSFIEKYDKNKLKSDRKKIAYDELKKMAKLHKDRRCCLFSEEEVNKLEKYRALLETEM